MEFLSSHHHWITAKIPPIPLEHSLSLSTRKNANTRWSGAMTKYSLQDCRQRWRHLNELDKTILICETENWFKIRLSWRSIRNFVNMSIKSAYSKDQTELVDSSSDSHSYFSTFDLNLNSCRISVTPRFIVWRCTNAWSGLWLSRIAN